MTGESRAFWLCVLAAPPVIARASLVFASVSLSAFVLLIVGAMVFELRVVTTRFCRPSLAQAAWRCAAAFGSVLTAIAFLKFFFRIHPHDRVSRTRVVLGRRVV